jgi:hypothetical protein
MKKIIIAIAGLVSLQSAMAQVVRDHTVKDPKTVPVTVTPVVTLLQPQTVVLYDQPNFAGQSKSFGVGDYRFTSPADFNDIASSIKVPAGMVAVIYEHANETIGYGAYIDLLEDCADLSVYNFNDKASFLRVFMAARPGFFYARNRTTNNEFVAGHWERERANGVKPDNTPPAVASSLSSTGYPDDYTYAPPATQAEIDQFNDIRTNQMEIGVLDGETTKAFYYHHNQPDEEVYKYNKVIDPARLPGKFFDWAAEKLGRAGIIVRPLEALVDIAGDIKDWIFGSSSTKMNMDCWFPVSEFKTTICGKMREDAEICTQDYIHTQVTVDKDVCLNIDPSGRFVSYLDNRWIGERSERVEGEVKTKNLANFNTQTQKSVETTTPRNPLLMQIKKDENVCLYGPWMADILDINLKIPIPFTDSKIDLANIDLRKNNEIHPINQLWRKTGNDFQLTAVVDGTGYFQKIGNGEVAASGLGQRMRFFIAFSLPAMQTVVNQVTREFNIDGVAFDVTDFPVLDVQPETLTLKFNGATRLKVNVNSISRAQKTVKVSFDRVKKRPDGSLQGYIVVETEPITKPGGSINIFVKDVSTRTNPIRTDRLPVKVRQ